MQIKRTRIPASAYRNRTRRAITAIINGSYEVAISHINYTGRPKIKVSYVEKDKEGNIIKDGKKYSEEEYKLYCKEKNIHYVTPKNNK
jgi:hypothetical protein